MIYQDEIRKLEEQRQALKDLRGKILGKLFSEREQRSQLLVKLMDIDDELEELSCQLKELSKQQSE